MVDIMSHQVSFMVFLLLFLLHLLDLLSDFRLGLGDELPQWPAVSHATHKRVLHRREQMTFNLTFNAYSNRMTVVVNTF